MLIHLCEISYTVHQCCHWNVWHCVGEKDPHIRPSDNYIYLNYSNQETVKQFKTTLTLINLLLSRSPERHPLHKCWYGLLTCEEGEGESMRIWAELNRVTFSPTAAWWNPALLILSLWIHVGRDADAKTAVCASDDKMVHKWQHKTM